MVLFGKEHGTFKKWSPEPLRWGVEGRGKGGGGRGRGSWAKGIATKPENLNSTPRTYIVGENQLPQYLHTVSLLHTHTHIHKCNKFI